MEDAKIVELYWQRDESAVAETAEKYGALCFRLAKNILVLREDAEECVSDAYRLAWESIPPQRPERLGAWLCRVVRTRALNRWSREHAQKRGRGAQQLLSELEDCLPAPGTVEQQAEAGELTALLNRWLAGCGEEDRRLFLRRYWYGFSVKELAKELGVAPGNVSGRLFRLRKDLKTALEREGYSV